MPMIGVESGRGGGSIAWVDPATKDVEVAPRAPAPSPGRRPSTWAAWNQRSPTPTSSSGYSTPTTSSAGACGSTARRRCSWPPTAVATPWASRRGGRAAHQAEGRRQHRRLGWPTSRAPGQRGRRLRPPRRTAGPAATHCCGYAEALGVERIITFPYSAVFSAFGSSTADVVHTPTPTPNRPRTPRPRAPRPRASPGDAIDGGRRRRPGHEFTLEALRRRPGDLRAGDLIASADGAPTALCTRPPCASRRAGPAGRLP